MSGFAPLSLFETEPRHDLAHVALGVFDGVHLGHQSLLQGIRRHHPHQPVTALTFWPHPLQIVQPDSTPPLLCSLDTRVDELHSAGAEHVMVLQFTDELRRLPPLDFLLLLKKKLPDLASITVGENFRFGFNRAGDATLLSDFKNRYGISGIRVPRLEDKFGPISSSRLRGLLSNGDFSTTERLLGRAWHLEGKIIRGDQIGRTLGFPTANFSVNGLCLPPYGVYQCRAWIGKSHYGAVVNLGVRPTLGLPPSPRGEAHLLGFDGDVYGQQMKLTDWKFLRPEMRFANLDELKSQISQDVKTAQRLFQE